MDNLTTIGAIAEIYDGPHATPKKTEIGPYFLSISSLINGRLDLSKSARLNQSDFLKWTKRVTPTKGDLLFSYETRLGEAALMPAGVTACLGRRMGLLRPKLNKVLPEYFLYAYMSPHFQQILTQNTITGATVNRIPISEMAAFPIRIPPMNEQQNVAALLCSIDEKIALNNKINTELEAMAKLIYDYWFVQFDFPDENGKPYKSSGGKMVYSEELKREIPNDWEIKKLEELSSKVGDGLHGTPIYVESSEYSFINGNNLKNGFVNITKDTKKVDYNEYKKNLVSLNKDSILLSINGTLGNLAIYCEERIMLGKSAAYINCLPEHQLYCYQSLSMEHIQKKLWQIATGSTIKNLSLASLKNLQLPYPSSDLLKLFDRKIKPIMNKRKNIYKENQKLTELRDWLLPMLMNGQVSIKDK